MKLSDPLPSVYRDGATESLYREAAHPSHRRLEEEASLGDRDAALEGALAREAGLAHYKIWQEEHRNRAEKAPEATNGPSEGHGSGDGEGGAEK